MSLHHTHHNSPLRLTCLLAVISALLLPSPTVLAAGATPEAFQRPAAAYAAPDVPPPECTAQVGYDRNMALPGYLLPTSLGPQTCIPFTTTAVRPPENYAGKDFYVDEFTDVKLRERWAACKADAACLDRVGKQVKGRAPPSREYETASPRTIYLLGKIKEEASVDLKLVRRPGFFAQAPYNEAVAEAESRTSTIELTAPADTWERVHRHSETPVKLRGWYVRGDGIDNGKGHKVRALVIMSGGGGTRLVGIDDPSERQYHVDAATREIVDNKFPSELSASPGQAFWRRTLYRLNRAGFDVLAYDRRGVGVSTGISDTNTLQQGRDLLEAVKALRSGDGLRVMTPSGQALQGVAASAALSAGAPAKSMPILLLGNSRGTMATSWAMTMNFDKNCSYDMSEIVCGPAVGLANIKGAILLAEFASGVGYVPAEMTARDETRGLGRDRGLFIAGSEMELNLVFFPSSATLAGIHTWPAAFFGRGLWDYATSLEGTMQSYSRVKGLKELVVVRGPHTIDTLPAEEEARLTERVLAFSHAAVLGKASVPGARPWRNMKELVGTTNDIWEPSSQPQPAPK